MTRKEERGVKMVIYVSVSVREGREEKMRRRERGRKRGKGEKAVYTSDA